MAISLEAAQSLSRSATTIEDLLDLEAFVMSCAHVNEAYDIDVFTTVARLYTLFPVAEVAGKSQYDRHAVVAHMLAKAMVRLPEADLINLQSILSLRVQNQLRSLLELADDLEACKFEAFWLKLDAAMARVKADETGEHKTEKHKRVATAATLPGFQDGVRALAVTAARESHRSISSDVLALWLHVPNAKEAEKYAKPTLKLSKDQLTFEREAGLAARANKVAAGDASGDADAEADYASLQKLLKHT